MDSNQLKTLSYSISYWSNEELETNVEAFLSQVFLSLDNEATRMSALRVIQQLNLRVAKGRVYRRQLSISRSLFTFLYGLF